MDQFAASLVQRIDSLEVECRHLRSLVLPQLSQSASISQVSVVSRQGTSEDEQRGCDVVPMDVEENTSSQEGLQEVPNNESAYC